ncbi:CRISPR-associated helicase Cas3', partial [Rubrivirga sp.]|uniref:CRISPR-associated helicase Cas3' n=1 Tax=Rubrivirga sp. TaxID=1885344 RepID=UPI003C765F4F
FTSSKRALLTPYGLGTIDQAMLGALRGRHFFLRMYGLAGKTVVLDEVHAYDVYMQTIIGTMVGWLRALGCSVVLLSATLPARLRRQLIQAWDSDANADLEADPAHVSYPAVWTVADGRVRLHDAVDGQPLSADRGQRATLRRHDPDLEAVAATVAQAVRDGAVVGVILNTVARAQLAFQAIKDACKADLEADDLVLFHARFLLRDRQRIERAVVGHRDDDEWIAGRFGKGRRDGPAVLVATQLAEQSLDLDVDLLVTDLAPIDLMLQRAGRLHRHDRDRPSGYAEPHVVWLCPDAPDGGLPDVTSTEVPFGFVYDPVVLWRTQRVLRALEDADGTGRWSLPDDYRRLIEAVYLADEEVTSQPPPPADLEADAAETWTKTVEDERAKMMASVQSAAGQTIPTSGRLAKLLRKSAPVLNDEDDDSAHRTLRVATREGDSLEVVVLHRGPDGALYLDADLEVAAPLDAEPERALSTDAVRALLGASLRLSQTRILGALRAADLEAWTDATENTPALRSMHALVLEDGSCSVGGYHVRFNDRLGLVLESPATS